MWEVTLPLYYQVIQHMDKNSTTVQFIKASYLDEDGLKKSKFPRFRPIELYSNAKDIDKVIDKIKDLPVMLDIHSWRRTQAYSFMESTDTFERDIDYASVIIKRNSRYVYNKIKLPSLFHEVKLSLNGQEFTTMITFSDRVRLANGRVVYNYFEDNFNGVPVSITHSMLMKMVRLEIVKPEYEAIYSFMIEKNDVPGLSFTCKQVDSIDDEQAEIIRSTIKKLLNNVILPSGVYELSCNDLDSSSNDDMLVTAYAVLRALAASIINVDHMERNYRLGYKLSTCVNNFLLGHRTGYELGSNYKLKSYDILERNAQAKGFANSNDVVLSPDEIKSVVLEMYDERNVSTQNKATIFDKILASLALTTMLASYGHDYTDISVENYMRLIHPKKEIYLGDDLLHPLSSSYRQEIDVDTFIGIVDMFFNKNSTVGLKSIAITCKNYRLGSEHAKILASYFKTQGLDIEFSGSRFGGSDYKGEYIRLIRKSLFPNLFK